MAKLITLRVEEGRFHHEGRLLHPGGFIRPEGAFGWYEVPQPDVDFFDNLGNRWYTYRVPGDGFYQFGPVYGCRLRRTFTDDPGLLIHGYYCGENGGCQNWAHWFSMTREAQRLYLRSHPGSEKHSNEWGQVINRPKIIFWGSHYWEWAAKNPRTHTQAFAQERGRLELATA